MAPASVVTKAQPLFAQIKTAATAENFTAAAACSDKLAGLDETSAKALVDCLTAVFVPAP